MNRFTVTLAGGVLMCILTAGTAHATAIDISTPAGYVVPFGEVNTATYGQTFTMTGTDTVLDNFSFRFDDFLNPDTVDFAAYVYAWDGTKATGTQLYASGKVTSSNNGGNGGMELFSFNTGGIELQSGVKYVAFLSASNFFDGIGGTSQWNLSHSDVYLGGEFVYENNGSNFSQLLASPWDCNSFQSIGGRDTFFIANFSAPRAVPEPATALLLGSGLLGLVGLNRRRKV
jgi:hypothetical protein